MVLIWKLFRLYIPTPGFAMFTAYKRSFLSMRVTKDQAVSHHKLHEALAKERLQLRAKGLIPPHVGTPYTTDAIQKKGTWMRVVEKAHFEGFGGGDVFDLLHAYRGTELDPNRYDDDIEDNPDGSFDMAPEARSASHSDSFCFDSHL